MPDPHNVFEHLDREPNAPRMSDLWEWARCDYFAGESADVVCERHKLSRSQFFERAKREGWLRRDQPRTSAEPAYDAEAEAAFIEDALDRPPPSAYTLYRRAWAMVERAIRMGRRVEAAGWTRVARDLRKLALQEHNTSFWTMVARAEEPKPDSPDSVRPPPFPGEVAAPQTEGGPSVQKEGRPETLVTPSVTAPAAPRHLPRGAGEAEGAPDSPDSDSPQAWGRLAFKPNRRQRRRERRLSCSPSSAALAPRARIDADRLGLQVGVQAFAAELAAPA